MNGQGRDDDLLAQFSLAREELSRQLLIPEPSLIRANAVRRLDSADPRLNVQAIGIGPKLVDNRFTGDPAIKIFVRTKLPQSEIDSANMLPRAVAGLPTDVEEIGLVQPLATRFNPRTRLRPARPGCSTGFQQDDPFDRMAGTFGALVEDDFGRYILSNNHVLADQNRLPFGTAIFEPGLFDGGDPDQDQIAVLDGYVPLDLMGPNYVDCAIARLLVPEFARADILQIGTPTGWATASLGTVVEKFGRTTAYTKGHVASINTDVKVPYDIGSVLFQDQVAIKSLDNRPFSEPGDSGALILEIDTGVAVGLLFAGSPAISFANHIEDALAAFDIDLVFSD